MVKLLDMWGTLLGMALLSVFTSIGAVLILRAMRRTGERFKAQVAAKSPAAAAETAPEAEATGRAHTRRRTVLAILVSSVLVFTLTLGTLAVFGKIATGDAGELIIDDRPDTTEVSPDSEQTPTSDEDTGDEPEETESPTSAEPSETPTDAATDEATEETPTEEPTTDGEGDGEDDSAAGDIEETPAADEPTSTATGN